MVAALIFAFTAAGCSAPEAPPTVPEPVAASVAPEVAPAPPPLKAQPFPGRLLYILESDLWLLEGAAPGAPRRLTEGKAAAHSPAWSPDGARLAWVEGAGRTALENKRLAIWDGTGVVRSPGQADFDPAWTPDGTALAGSFGPAAGIPRRIRRLDLTGKVLPDRCPEGGGNPARADYHPFFTPDGGMFFVWRVDEFPASVVWTGPNCREVAAVVPQMDVPDGFYGAFDWSRVMDWPPVSR